MWTVGVIDLEGLDCFGPYQFELFNLIFFAEESREAALATFHEENVDLGMIQMRMQFNQQRHPILFLADLTPEQVTYFSSHRTIKDCVKLIKSASKFALGRGHKGNLKLLQGYHRCLKPFKVDEGAEEIRVCL